VPPNCPRSPGWAATSRTWPRRPARAGAAGARVADRLVARAEPGPGGLQWRMVPRPGRHRAAVPAAGRGRPAAAVAAGHRRLPAGAARQPPARAAAPGYWDNLARCCGTAGVGSGDWAVPVMDLTPIRAAAPGTASPGPGTAAGPEHAGLFCRSCATPGLSGRSRSRLGMRLTSLAGLCGCALAPRPPGRERWCWRQHPAAAHAQLSAGSRLAASVVTAVARR
jgi:hypothetical protein